MNYKLLLSLQRLSLCLLCTVVTTFALRAQRSISAEELQQLHQQLSSAEEEYNAHLGVAIHRLGDSVPLFAYRAGELFTPASVVKLTSTAAALALRGPDFRFSTPIYICGVIKEGRLEGDLLIRRGGDPSLGSRFIPQDSNRFIHECIQFLKSQGIHTITGDIFIDASLPTGQGTPSSWMLEDIDEAYGAGLYGVNYRDNAVTKVFKHKVRISIPKRKSRKRKKARPARVSTKMVKQSRRVAESDPATQLSEDLKVALGRASVRLVGDMEVSYDPIEVDQLGEPSFVYQSQPLDTLVRITNHRSVNLFAEGIGQILSSDSVYRADSISAYWYRTLGLRPNSLHLYDASGLSRKNNLTPNVLKSLLLHMLGVEEPVRSAFYSSLPRAGEEGTVKGFLRGQRIEAYLKSGSMQGVMCYAGYVRYQGDDYAVVLMANNFPSAGIPRGVYTKLLKALFL